MSNLESLLVRLLDLTRDKQKKAALQKICEDIKHLPETANPQERFKEKHEVLMTIFMNVSDFIKLSGVPQILNSLKLLKLILPYLEEAKSDQTTVHLTIRYVFTDMPTVKEEVVEEVVQLILGLTDCSTLFSPQLQRLAVMKLYEFLQLKSLRTEAKAIVEVCLQKVYQYTFDHNSSFNVFMTTYFGLCLTSEDTAIDLGESMALQKLHPLIVLNTVLNVVPSVKEPEKISSLCKTIMKRKFQLQKFGDDTYKFLMGVSLPEGFKVKNFAQTQVVFLYCLLQQAKVKQPVLSQLLFLMLQFQLAALDQTSKENKYEFLMTLLDQIKNVGSEDQLYQYDLILLYMAAMLRHLSENDMLHDDFIFTVLKHLNQYFLVLKQLQPTQQKYVGQPSLFVHDVLKQSAQSFSMQEIDDVFVTNPLNLGFCTARDQQSIMTMLSVQLLVTICHAYNAQKLNKFDAENLAILKNLCIYFITEFGKTDTASYLTTACVAALCGVLQQLEKEDDFKDRYEEMYNAILTYVLNVPKVMLQRDPKQPWTAPFKLSNKRSMQEVYICIINCFHRLRYIKLEHFTDIHYTGLSLVLSLYMQSTQQLSFQEFQQFITQNMAQESERGFVEAFASFYNMKTDEEESALERKFIITQHVEYLESLCEVILGEVTPKKYVELISQVLVNEIIFPKDQEIQFILDLGMSDLYQRVLERQLEQKQLRQKTRRIITEFVKFQLIAQQKDVALPDHYQRISNYLQTISTESLVQFDFLKPLKKLFQSDDLAFVVDAIIQIVQFAQDCDMELVNIVYLEEFIQEFIDANRYNCQQAFITLLNILTGTERVRCLRMQTQQHLLELLFDVINRFYESKMQCPLDESTLLKTARDFYCATNYPGIFFETIEYLYLQCVNSASNSKLIATYLQMISAIIQSSQDAYLISQKRLPTVALNQLTYLYVGKIGEAIALQYRDNPTSSNLRNYEELLRVYSGLILYLSDNFGHLGAFAFAGYLNGLVQTDQNLLRLQLQYCLQIVFRDSLRNALFCQEQDAEAFWAESATIEQGVRFERFETRFMLDLLCDLAGYLQTQQETMFAEANLRNFLTLLVRLEAVNDGLYAEKVLDTLIYVAVQFDVAKGTAYDESRLLTSTQSSSLPVTMAYSAQRQLERFLTRESTPEALRIAACARITPKLLETRNVASVRMLLRIISGQFDTLSAAGKAVVFEALAEFVFSQAFEEVCASFGYGEMLFGHVLLRMLGTLIFDDGCEKAPEWALKTAQWVRKLPWRAVVLKVHCLGFLARAYGKMASDEIFQELLVQIKDANEQWLPSAEKVDPSVRVYAVCDFDLVPMTQGEFTHQSFDMLYELKAKANGGADAEADSSPSEADPIELLSGSSILAKTVGDAIFALGMHVVTWLSSAQPNAIRDFQTAQFKAIAARYCKNHVHEANFITWMTQFIDQQTQSLPNVYRAACALFEQANWLVSIRTHFLDQLGTLMGWNDQ